MKSFEKLTVTGCVAILRRRVWWFVITFVLTIAGATAYIWRIPSIYKSETTILVSGRLLPEDYIGSIVRDTPDDRVAFLRQRLDSRMLLERIVQEFQFNRPPRTMEQAVNSVRGSKEITFIPPNVVKLGFVSTDAVIAQSVARRLAESVIQLNDSLRKDQVHVAGQFLDTELRQAANDLTAAEQKLRDFNSKHFHGAPTQGVNADTVTQLRAQLDNLDKDLDLAIAQRKDMEQRLVEHRQLRSAVTYARPEAPTPAQTTASQKPSPLEEKLALKKAELLSLQGKYTSSYPDVVRLTREIAELEPKVREAQLQAAKEAPPAAAANDNSRKALPLPEVDSVDFSQAEIQFELDSLKRDIAKRQQARQELANRINAFNARLNPAPDVAQELTAITQDYDTAKQRYAYLSTRELNAGLAARVDTSEDNQLFKVIDEANLPQIPFYPNRVQLAGIGFIAALLLGIGAVFGRELLDSSISDEEDAVTRLNVPVLISLPLLSQSRTAKAAARRQKFETTIVPKLRVAGDTSAGRFSLEASDPNIKEIILNPTTIAGEQYRLLRARLSTAQKQKGVKTLLITSALPGDGKTFVACSLAGTLAQESGKKVLLIDADLRTGQVARAIGLDGNVGGLSDLLRHGRDAEQLTFDSSAMPALDLKRYLLKCAEVNLNLLPAGAMTAHPPELFSSPVLEKLLRHAEQFFDWIIIDSPPILGLADANLILPLCSAAVVVVSSERTPEAEVKETLARIGPERFGGIILNRIRKIRSAAYYSYYYRQTEPDKRA
jgi:polysaccharide biosynthesis transport protein